MNLAAASATLSTVNISQATPDDAEDLARRARVRESVSHARSPTRSAASPDR